MPVHHGNVSGQQGLENGIKVLSLHKASLSPCPQVYSHLAIAAGSDKAVRILDLNKGAIAAENSQVRNYERGI